MSLLLSVFGFEEKRAKNALDMLLIDRKNEFRELAETIFWNIPPSLGPIKNWEVFVLNFCLEVNEAFKTWVGKAELKPNSAMKALTILRQLSHDKSSMTPVAYSLNLAYTLAEEFKVIYRRIE